MSALSTRWEIIALFPNTKSSNISGAVGSNNCTGQLGDDCYMLLSEHDKLIYNCNTSIDPMIVRYGSCLLHTILVHDKPLVQTIGLVWRDLYYNHP